MKKGLRLLGFVLILAMSWPSVAASVQMVEEHQPYIYGWQWDSKPDSMVRIPRRIASGSGWVSEDQPLRVQKVLPKYRHHRSAAQIHWEVMREINP